MTMRIAISGTHSQGKSTFCRDFLARHSDYIFENEPYRALKDEHEILFGDYQTQHHIDLQLNYCLEQVKKYKPGDKVLFDRLPADYIPYSAYTAHNAHTDINKAYVDSLYKRIKPVMHHLDLIVFIPMTEDYLIELEDDGHRPVEDFYRTWVDHAFKIMYHDELEQILPAVNAPKIVEITGPREARIALLETIIQEMESTLRIL